MADIDSIDMRDDKILVSLRLSKDEYNILRQSTKGLLLLPTDSHTLNESLTTGKLGNSNRIMLPNKILQKHNVTSFLKKVPAQVFDVFDEKFLLIKLQESRIGRPVFGEEK
ncbi:MAG: hypothetical protein V1678_00300 [Candidatus Aenigmatarchaeota archaeon]